MNTDIFVRKQGPHAPDCAIALNGRHACSCMKDAPAAEVIGSGDLKPDLKSRIHKRADDPNIYACDYDAKPLPIPDAMYSCGVRFCAEEMSYTADMLFWSQRFGRWFCADCWRDWHADGVEKGISLAEEIERQKGRL